MSEVDRVEIRICHAMLVIAGKSLRGRSKLAVEEIRKVVPIAAESTGQAPRKNDIRERRPKMAEQVVVGNHVRPLVCSLDSDVQFADVQDAQ